MAVETPEFAAMLRRMVKALGRRLADGDPVDLAELLAVQKELDAALDEAVRGQRRQFSWDEIGQGLGVSRQAAQKRFR